MTTVFIALPVSTGLTALVKSRFTVGVSGVAMSTARLALACAAGLPARSLTAANAV